MLALEKQMQLDAFLNKSNIKKKIKPLRAKYTQHKGERITRKSLYIKLGILAGKID